MDEDLVYSVVINGTKVLCVSSISSVEFQECAAQSFESERGYFVYERDIEGKSGISILAKLASMEAAFRFIDVIDQATARAANTLSSYSLPEMKAPPPSQSAEIAVRC